MTNFRQEEIATKIVNAAFRVHKTLGPALLEKIYEACLIHELSKEGLSCERQVSIPIVYDGICFDEGCRIDILVEKQIIVEIKASENLNQLWEAQLISYLKLLDLHLGFLINFKVPLIKHGIHRYVI